MLCESLFDQMMRVFDILYDQMDQYRIDDNGNPLVKLYEKLFWIPLPKIDGTIPFKIGGQTIDKVVEV